MPAHQFEQSLNSLPEGMRLKIQKFYRWQDAHAGLLGKLLLVHALQATGWQHLVLSQVRSTPFGRPYFEAGLDFNISHSGQYVICALSTTGRVGIDLEEISTIDWPSFQDQFTLAEWTSIKTCVNPTRQFYQYWTRKEAIIKADGRGLQLPLQQICTANELVNVGGTSWYTKELLIDDGYVTSISTSAVAEEVIVKKVLFY